VNAAELAGRTVRARVLIGCHDRVRCRFQDREGEERLWALCARMTAR
jgi:hypothetical protein